MSQRHKIPRRGKAGVAFLGVELKEAWPILMSVFVALIVGGPLGGGSMAYLGIPIAGYFLNRALIEWNSHQLPGAQLEWLYQQGLTGYSKTIKSQKVIYCGDNTAINRASRPLVTGLITKAKEIRSGNVST